MTARMTKTIVKSIGILIVICAMGFLSTCEYVSNKGNSAYKQVAVGDTLQTVRTRFDMPYATQSANVGFPGYTAEGCKPGCAQRIWFVNRWSLTGEAWSVDFDGSERVMGKYHWMSP